MTIKLDYPRAECSPQPVVYGGVSYEDAFKWLGIPNECCPGCRRRIPSPRPTWLHGTGRTTQRLQETETLAFLAEQLALEL